jgi:HlyD family secretion protein/epimerase transport system membrane fusion protein
MPALRPEVDATATTAADGRGGAASPPGPVNPPASADLAEQPALATVASGSAEGPEAAPAANRTQTGAESPASTSESHSADEQASRSEALQPAGLGEPDARADPYPPAMPSVEAEPSPDAPTGSRRFIIAGILALVLGVGVLGGWAALAPLQSASIAPGVIRTAGGHRTVQHLEGGIIDEVLVEDGNRVETGQVLIRLESAQARANRDLLRGRHDALSTLLARLLSERDGKPAIEYSAEILARMDTPEVARLVAGETDVFNARREAMKGQLDILDRRLKQSRQEIAGLEAQRASSRKQISLVNEELAAARTLYEKGIYEKPKYLALQRTVAKFDGDIGEFAANIARTQERIAETESAILDVGNQRLKEVTDRLQETQRQLFDTEDRLRAAEDVLERTLIRAPDGGVVVGLRYRTRGGVIPPHATLLEIVPADDTPVVDARISPGDIDSVHEGLRADVRLTAFSYRTTPLVEGTLVRVSADRLLDDKTGQPYYEGRIELDPASLARAKHIQLYPGMAAEVHIITGERTVLQYLLRPITDSLSRTWREG